MRIPTGIGMNHPLRFDHYKILGVDRMAGPAEIKRAYREQVKRAHPDRNRSPRAAELFQAVHDAYLVLSDPEERRRYDERLSYHRPARPEARPMGPGRGTREQRAWSMGQEVLDNDSPVRPWVFYGLHLTGLLFGLLLVFGVLFLIVFREASWALFVFTAPGWFLIPDCFSMLRFNTKAPS